jgi:hypothetical protein
LADGQQLGGGRARTSVHRRPVATLHDDAQARDAQTLALADDEAVQRRFARAAGAVG